MVPKCEICGEPLGRLGKFSRDFRPFCSQECYALAAGLEAQPDAGKIRRIACTEFAAAVRLVQDRCGAGADKTVVVSETIAGLLSLAAFIARSSGLPEQAFKKAYAATAAYEYAQEEVADG
jgi:hypothetical protein